MNQNNSGMSLRHPGEINAGALKTNIERKSGLSRSMALLGCAFMFSLQFLTGKASAQVASYVGTGGTSTTITYYSNESGTTLQKTGFGSNTPCGSGGLSGLTNNGVTTYDPTHAHVYFTVTPNTGYQLNITSFTAKLRRSASGISKVRFAYSLDGGTTWANDSTDNNPDNTSCGGGTTVFSWNTTHGGALPTAITGSIIFALYPYAPIASGGVVQVNNITIGGSIVPAGACTGTPAAGVAVASPASICGSGSSTLTLSGAAIAPGISYQWVSSTAGTIAGATNTTYTTPVLSSTDTYSAVTTCSFSGLSSTSSPATVTVNPFPSAITGTTTIAQGTTSTLSDATAGGTWSSSDTHIATVGTAGDVTGVASGSASIIYTLPTGCSASATVTVPTISFSCGNLVVLTANGTSSSSAAITLREYDRNTANQAAPISQDGLPTTGGARLTQSGSATTEGHLALDAEWTHLIYVGYDAAAGVPSIANANVNRNVFSTDGSASNTLVSSVSYLDAFKPLTSSPGNIRSGVASGSNYFAAGTTSSTATTAGIQLMGATTSAQVCSTTVNTRVVNIFNGQLYYSTGSGTRGIYAVGSGIPTTLSTGTNLFDFGDTSSPQGFSFSPDGNTLYIADDRSTAGKGIYKYTLSGGLWSFAYKLADSAGARSIAVDYSTIPYTIYATTASGSSTVRDTLVKIVDSNATAARLNLAVSDSGSSFKGVSFVPCCNVKLYTFSPANFCTGDSAKLIFYGNPGATVVYTDGTNNYTITLNNSGVDTVSTGALTATSAPVNYTFSLVSITTSVCQNAQVSGSVSFVVNQFPVVGPISDTTICNHDEIYLSDTQANGIWSSSDETVVLVDDEETGALIGVSVGTATVSYILTNSCGADTATATITVIDCGVASRHAATTGVANVNAADAISVFPVPAHATLFIQSSDKVNVSVMSMDGKVLIEQKNAVNVNVGNLADGMYMMKIYDQNNNLVKTVKFTKE